MPLSRGFVKREFKNSLESSELTNTVRLCLPLMPEQNPKVLAWGVFKTEPLGRSNNNNAFPILEVFLGIFKGFN